MRIDPDAGLITLEVEVFRGSKSRIIRMALDTGATFLMLPWDIAAILGYDVAQIQERLSITTASGVEIVPLLTLERVRVLGQEIRRVKAICHNLPAQSAVDGLLGLSFLKHFDIDLYFRQGRLEFHR